MIYWVYHLQLNSQQHHLQHHLGKIYSSSFCLNLSFSRGADDIFGDFESAQPVAAAPASQPQATQQAPSSTSEPGKKSNADILSLFSQAPPQQQQFNQFQQQAPQQQMFGNFSQQQFSPQQQQPPSGGSFDMLGLGKLTFDVLYFFIFYF